MGRNFVHTFVVEPLTVERVCRDPEVHHLSVLLESTYKCSSLCNASVFTLILVLVAQVARGGDRNDVERAKFPAGT